MSPDTTATATATEAAAVAALLDGGAVLTAAAVPDDEPRTDTVTARRYRHPALGERPVIRLVGSIVGPAEDGALETLGFAAPETVTEVGVGRRRGLGFPGWVLVNAPKHSKLALSVVKPVERAARQARSKPGHAKDAFEAIARQIGEKAPVALPSLHEHAARAFLVDGNQRMAAVFFEKAREAERVHALPVDEEARRDVFLEFAFAGAVSVRSLTDHSATLRAQHDPDTAYELFLELLVRRTLGGLPPWTGTAKELRSLVKAAGRDAAAEDERLMEVLLATPATERAAAGFWKPYRAALVRLLRRDAGAATTARELSPTHELIGWWMAVLRDGGALEPLTRPTSEDGAAAPGYPAAWLSRQIARCTNGWRSVDAPPELAEIAELAAPRLIADGVEVTPWQGARLAEINLIDHLLALGVPVAHPEQRSISLDNLGEGDENPRDLTAIAADTRFARALSNGVDAFGGSSRKLDLLLASPGLAPLVAAWVHERVARVGGRGLSPAHDDIEALAAATTAATFTAAAGAHGTLATVEVAPTLARTLRGGLPDELGWPALEEAVAELTPGEIETRAAWPDLVVHDNENVIVVSRDGVVMRHRMRVPTDAYRWGRTAIWSQQQLLVTFSTSDGTKAYWSSEPDEPFSLSLPYLGRVETAVWTADGACSLGGRAVHAGDRAVSSDSGDTASDGTSFWRHEAEPGYAADGSWRQRHHMIEFDPVTGQSGRESMPRWFEDFVPDAGEILIQRCRLLPAGPELADSPLGWHDGRVGLRVRTVEAAGGSLIQAETVDGTAVTLPAGRSGVTGLVRLPGRSEPVVLTDSGLYDTDGRFNLSRVGWGDLRASNRYSYRQAPREAGFVSGGTNFWPTSAYWHNLRPRDEAGSLALRGIDDAVASRLLEAGRSDRAETAEGNDTTASIRAELARSLPQITDPRLIEGVVSTVADAARVDAELSHLVADRDPEGGDPAGPAAELSDEQFIGVRDLVEQGGYYYGSDNGRPVAQMHLVAGYLRGEAPLRAVTGDLPRSGFAWPDLVGFLRAVACRATSAAEPVAQREQLLQVLSAWATTAFVGDQRGLRTTRVAGADAAAGSSGDSRFVILPGSGYGANESWALDVGGALPPKATVVRSWDGGIDWTAEQISEFVAEARRRGPVTVDSEAAAELQRRTGMAQAEAVLVLGGLPNIDTWAANFLDADQRAALGGIKMADAKAVRDGLRALPRPVRKALIAAGAGDDPTDRWSPLGTGPDDDASPVARIAAVWNEHVGRKATVSEEALKAGAKVTGTTPATQWLQWYADAAIGSPLHRPGATKPDYSYSTATEGFGIDHAVTVAATLPWVAARPVGDPLRSGAAPVFDLVRERLSQPDLIVRVGWTYIETSQVPAVLDRFGTRGLDGLSPEYSRDAGALVVANRQGSLVLFARPALIDDDTDLSPVLAIAGNDGPGGGALLRSLLDLLPGGSVEAFVERIGSTPVADGGYEADPTQSVPDLVAAAATELGIDVEPAALFLQLLTLGDPTDRNVRTWNDWTPARHKKAQAALVEAGLVLEAKRARAGRSAFLPGGWAPANSPDLPVETWKMTHLLLSLTDTGKAVGHYTPTVLPAPHHQLFATAWDRYRSGDRPGATS